MTFKELLETNRIVRSIYEECQSPKPMNADFCAYQFWQGLPGKRGLFGMKHAIKKNVPPEHQELVLSNCRAVIPECKHKIDIAWTEEDGTPHECVCPSDYPTPPPTTEPGMYSLERKKVCDICGAETDGVMSLTESLRHAAGDMSHPERLLVDSWHDKDGKIINDLKEPVFVVRSREEGRALSERLNIIDRWKDRTLSWWYVENCIYVVDAPTREVLLDMNLTKATVTGAISWKPVVMAFADAEVERKLAQVCTQVHVVLPVEGRDYLAEVQAALQQKIAELVTTTSDDLPVECLDGWLGEVCRERLKDYPLAYSWPALLSAASVLVTRDLLPEGNRVNLFTGLIGPVGSGKTCVFNEAFRLLALKDRPMAPVAENEVVRLKAGSGEGMAQKIGDVGGASKLVFVDELEHLMKKVNIKGSTFANTLDDAYTTDAQQATVEHRKEIPLHVRLSLAGGLPEEVFSEAFGAGTVGGLHSRFMFGVCPSSYPGYCWAPPQGRPALERTDASEEFDSLPASAGRPSRIDIDAAVWKETARWQRELNLHGRAVEMAMKAAIISAAFDNRGTLTVAQLRPALAFARYQDAVHRRFLPNPGKNDDAMLENDVTKYMQEHAPHGDWINRKKMLDAINAYRYGSNVINRVLAAMSQNRIIELNKIGRQLVVRLVVDKK